MTCEHENIDWWTLQVARHQEGVLDINCADCGDSGSILVGPEDIQWPENPEDEDDEYD